MANSQRGAVAPSPDESAVVTKAVMRAAHDLGVSQADLGRVLGMSRSSVTRLKQGATLSADVKSYELALLFLRAYRSLSSLLGGDGEHCRAWLRAENRHLNGRPIELMKTVRGLVDVVEYLDAMRG